MDTQLTYLVIPEQQCIGTDESVVLDGHHHRDIPVGRLVEDGEGGIEK